VPADGGRREGGVPSNFFKFPAAKAPSDGDRAVVLHHGGEAEETTEGPEAGPGKGVAVEIVDHQARSAHPVHFSKQSRDIRPVEVVEKKGGVRHVDSIRVVAEGQRVPDLRPGAGSKGGRELGVEVGAGMAHGRWIRVYPYSPNRAPELRPSSDEVDEVIAASAAEVEHREFITSSEKRVEGGVGCGVAPEQPVGEAEIL